METGGVLKALCPEVREKLRSGVSINSLTQCVEELVLNALDATSTNIAVRLNIEQGRIQVVDNGTGINRDNLQKIATRYVTSKCHSVEDLSQLFYFGYRGEALASIRDICESLEIESLTRTSSSTYVRRFQEGKPASLIDALIPRPSPGTTLTVCDLFSKIPVRHQCMNDGLEMETVRRWLEAMALIHPYVAFSLRNDITREKMLQTRRCESVRVAFKQLFGAPLADELIALRGQQGVYNVTGYISRELYHNDELQYIYVNNRLVLRTQLHTLMNSLIKQSAIGRKYAEEYSEGVDDTTTQRVKDSRGIFVVNITCPLRKYDITFEPRKTMMEFKNWDKVTTCLQYAVKKSLEKEGLVGLNGEVNGKHTWEELPAIDQDEDLVLGSQDDHVTAKYGARISTWNNPNNLQSSKVSRRNINTVIQLGDASTDSAEINPPSQDGQSDPIQGEHSPARSVENVPEQNENFEASSSLSETCAGKEDTSQPKSGRETSQSLEYVIFETPLLRQGELGAASEDNRNTGQKNKPKLLRNITRAPHDTNSGSQREADRDRSGGERISHPAKRKRVKDNHSCKKSDHTSYKKPNHADNVEPCRRGGKKSKHTGDRNPISTDGGRINLTGREKPDHAGGKVCNHTAGNSPSPPYTKSVRQATGMSPKQMDVHTSDATLKSHQHPRDERDTGRPKVLISLATTNMAEQPGDGRETAKDPNKANKELFDPKRLLKGLVLLRQKHQASYSRADYLQCPTTEEPQQSREEITGFAKQLNNTNEQQRRSYHPEHSPEQKNVKCCPCNPSSFPARSDHGRSIQDCSSPRGIPGLGTQGNCREVPSQSRPIANGIFTGTRVLDDIHHPEENRDTPCEYKGFHPCQAGLEQVPPASRHRTMNLDAPPSSRPVHSTIVPAQVDFPTSFAQNYHAKNRDTWWTSSSSFLHDINDVIDSGIAAAPVRPFPLTDSWPHASNHRHRNVDFIANLESVRPVKYRDRCPPSPAYVNDDITFSNVHVPLSHDGRDSRIICSPNMTSDEEDHSYSRRPQSTAGIRSHKRVSWADSPNLLNPDESDVNLHHTERMTSLAPWTACDIPSHFPTNHSLVDEMSGKLHWNLRHISDHSSSVLEKGIGQTTDRYQSSRLEEGQSGQSFTSNMWPSIPLWHTNDSETLRSPQPHDALRPLPRQPLHNANTPAEISPRRTISSHFPPQSKLQGQGSNMALLQDGDINDFSSTAESNIDLGDRQKLLSASTNTRDVSHQSGVDDNLESVACSSHETDVLTMSYLDRASNNHCDLIQDELPPKKPLPVHDLMREQSTAALDSRCVGETPPVGSYGHDRWKAPPVTYAVSHLDNILSAPSFVISANGTGHVTSTLKHSEPGHTLQPSSPTPMNQQTHAIYQNVSDAQTLNEDFVPVPTPQEIVGRMENRLKTANLSEAPVPKSDQAQSPDPSESVSVIVPDKSGAGTADAAGASVQARQQYPLTTGGLPPVVQLKSILSRIDDAVDATGSYIGASLLNIPSNTANGTYNTSSITQTVTTCETTREQHITPNINGSTTCTEPVCSPNEPPAAIDTPMDTSTSRILLPEVEKDASLVEVNISPFQETQGFEYILYETQPFDVQITKAETTPKVEGNTNGHDSSPSTLDNGEDYLNVEKAFSTTEEQSESYPGPSVGVQAVPTQGKRSGGNGSSISSAENSPEMVSQCSQLSVTEVASLQLQERCVITSQDSSRETNVTNDENDEFEAWTCSFENKLMENLTNQLKDSDLSMRGEPEPHLASDDNHLMVSGDMNEDDDHTIENVSWSTELSDKSSEKHAPDDTMLTDYQEAIVLPDHQLQENANGMTVPPACLETLSHAESGVQATDKDGHSEQPINCEPLSQLNRQNASSMSDSQEEIPCNQQAWKYHEDSISGRQIRISRVTGESSFQEESSRNEDISDESTCELITGMRQTNKILPSTATAFLGHGRSYRMQTGKAKLCAGAGDEDSVRDMVDKYTSSADDNTSKWRNTAETNDHRDDAKVGVGEMLNQWDNPVNSIIEKDILNMEVGHQGVTAIQANQALYSQQFTKDMLKGLQVIGQVDNKFIACRMTQSRPSTVATGDAECGGDLLVLVDQHAAHERIRLQQLTSECMERVGGCRKVRTRSINPEVVLRLTRSDIRLMRVYKDVFNNIGVYFTIDDTAPDKVSLRSIPACYTSVDSGVMEMLIKKQVEALKWTRGACGNIPKLIHDELCSQACHGAIKFGDVLSVEECQQLMKDLSSCDLPFQCAHGRPSLLPLLDLTHLAHTYPTPQVEKPKLKKLGMKFTP